VYAWNYGGEIATTGASVEIFKDDVLVSTITVPTSPSGYQAWAIACISYNGTVTPINTLHETRDNYYSTELPYC